jgi:hypothetical protein
MTRRSVILAGTGSLVLSDGGIYEFEPASEEAR